MQFIDTFPGSTQSRVHSGKIFIGAFHIINANFDAPKLPWLLLYLFEFNEQDLSKKKKCTKLTNKFQKST